MIRLENVSKTYAKSGRKAVDGLSLSIPDGKIFGFLGPNGAGKTTTIRIACGALQPDQGEAWIDKVNMGSDPMVAKRRIGLVHDNPELFNKLKAHEYLDFIGDVFEVPQGERRSRVEEFAARFEIADMLGSSIGAMSRGMKQKLCVVASLIHDPANWILDEPMVGLDPQASFQLKEIMRERTQGGKCVFFSTHVMEVAERLCDRLAIIARGKIIFDGNLGELRALREGAGGGDQSLERLFLDMVADV
ncbi:MAG: ABC-2 type transport system ATP-binding protein [Spirochaetes bacterium]|nr:MAG: ABC-2 type transport system ATP-binding protein [Spirochaetota bacterium]